MAKFMDLTDQRFSKLIVISRAVNNTRNTRWNCKCDCGRKCVVTACNLRNGHTKSCGCVRALTMGNTFRTHGRTESQSYRTWCGIKARCYKPSASNYYLYGARGVTVCDRWLQSFENFYADMGDPPTKKHSIDRKDNSLGYSPDNCKWSTQIEQANNKGTNVIVTFNGKTQTLAEWARELNLTRSALAYRLKTWPSTERIFLTPLRRSSR